MRRKSGTSSVVSGVRQVPLSLQNLCKEFAHAGAVYLDALTLAIEQAAPRPGDLICLQTRKFPMNLNGLEPSVFSAIDVSTHLQVARIYLAMTRAAAVDFVDFVSQSFSFPIREIRTLAAPPFVPSADDSHNDFTSAMKARGIHHSTVENPREDALFSLLTKLMFGGASELPSMPVSNDNLHGELAQFLFFHNNYQSLPWLGGKTPLQRLNAHRRLAAVHSFDPSGFFGAGDRRGRAHQSSSAKQKPLARTGNPTSTALPSHKKPSQMKG